MADRARVLPGRSALRVIHDEMREDPKAKRDHASWKFQLHETVNCDPQAGGACLQVIVAYSHFCSERDRTAYLSEIDLQVRTGGLPTRRLREAKTILERLGYMERAGVTKAGIKIYRLANPRKETIAEHRAIATEKLKEDAAFQREEERRRARIGRCEYAPPKTARGGADVHPTGGANMHPNTVENSLEELLLKQQHSAGAAEKAKRWTIPEGWPPLPGKGG